MYSRSNGGGAGSRYSGVANNLRSTRGTDSVGSCFGANSNVRPVNKEAELGGVENKGRNLRQLSDAEYQDKRLKVLYIFHM